MEENNLNKKVKEKKPVTLKSLLIKRIIFIIIFLLATIGITVYFILNSSSEEKSNSDKEKEDEIEYKEVSIVDRVSSGEKTLSLNDTYDLNALKYTYIPKDYNGIEVTYIQIDGLKESNIENSINKNLREDIEKAIDDALEENEEIRENLYVNAYVSSNYANTISSYYFLYSYKKNNNEYETLLEKYIIENYDLTTGNRITIEDIFSQDTIAADILNSATYNDIVQRYATTEMDEENWNLYITDYNVDAEEIMLELATKINNREDLSFIFDEQSVSFIDYSVTVYFKNVMDKIVIYNKFITDDSIFDEEYETLTNLPILAKRYLYRVEHQFINESDEYYIDFTFVLNKQTEEEIIDIVKDKITEISKEIKERAGSTNQFIIANYGFTLNTVNDFKGSEDYDGLYMLSMQGGELVTTKSKFESELYERILDSFRYYPEVEGGDIYMYNNIFLYYINDSYKSGKYEQYSETIDYTTNYTDIYFDENGNFYDSLEDAMNANYELVEQ